MAINTMRFWLRWGGSLFVVLGSLLVIVPRFMSVPDRAALRSAEGWVVNIAYERQDAKSSMPPSAWLHVRARDGEVRRVGVHPRRVEPTEISSFKGREVSALHDDRGNAYELIVDGAKLLDYDVFANQRRETLAGIPLYGAGIAALGTLMVLIGLYLFGGPPAAATPPIPTRRRDRRVV